MKTPNTIIDELHRIRLDQASATARLNARLDAILEMLPSNAQRVTVPRRYWSDDDALALKSWKS